MAERIGANQDAAAQYGNIGAGGNAGSTPGVSGDFSGSGGGRFDEIANAARSFLAGVGAGVNGAFDGSSQASQNDYAAQQAAYAAQQAAAREAALNLAKQQAKDRKIAADAQKAQRSRVKAPSAPSAQMETGKKSEEAKAGAKKGHDTIVITADDKVADTASGELLDEGEKKRNKVSDNELRGRAPAAPQAPNAPAAPKSGSRTYNNAKRKNMPTPAGTTAPAAQPAASAAPRQNSSRTAAQPAAPAAPAAPVAPQAPSVAAQLTDRQLADKFFRDYSRSRTSRARDRNIKNEANYNAWRQKNPEADEMDWYRQHPTDAEGFEYTPDSLMKTKYRSNREFETQVDPETGEPVKQRKAGRDFKNTKRQDRLIDRLVNDLRLGFFHVTTERVMEDEETGEQYMQWSLPVEDSMNRLMEYFGLHGIDGQRTVFRLVRLYASMSVDRDGKMFGEDRNEWSLTEDEFCDICDLIERSCVEYGHPMGFYRYKLRGTDVYPSGVMPKVVARAITGPNSKLGMTADQLMEACANEWLSRTYPIMKSNTKGDKIGQRIVIEDMQQAIARLDGMDVTTFSERYGVDTTLHYKLTEYSNMNAEYAAVTNGKYDSKAVAEENQRTISEYEKESKIRSGRAKRKGVLKKRYIELDNREEETFPEAGLTLVTSLARINSILFRPAIAMASIPEKGVGNLSTWLAISGIRCLRKDGGVYEVSDWALNQMKSEDAVRALDAAKMLFEVGGPGAARLFAQEGKPMTHENVVSFLRNNYMKQPTLSASKVATMLEQLNKFSQKMLVGDLVFRKSDTMNWFNALIAANAAEARAQAVARGEGAEWQRSGDRANNAGSIALTGDEIEDIMAAHSDITGFFTEMMGTDAGISAYNMMRGNSIAQINPISYHVDRFLRDHGVTNAAITLFLDTFPTYGINYIYNIWPFSRTCSYLAVKRKQNNGSLTEGDLVIGGNLTGFYEGLRMNLIYDAVTLGRNSLIGGIAALAFLALGFEPPDDENNWGNISMWKIGGQEVQWAWWLNDLTQLGLPNAYFLAAGIKTGDWKLAGQLWMDCLHDQVDGNVLLDAVDLVTNWRQDIFEFDQMVNDPSYTGPTDRWSFALAELYSAGLRAGNKLTPGQPLMDSFYRSALIRGIDARTKDPGKVYKHSEDPELDKWYQEHGVTESVDNYFEYLDRKYSMTNLAYAWFFNTFRNQGDASKTGYNWWEMPNKTFSNPVTLAWSGEFHMDYDNMGDCQTRTEYDQEMACKVLDYIQMFQEEGLTAEEAAAKYGFIIPHDARAATLNYLYNVELKRIDTDWKDRNASGELADKNVYQVAKSEYYEERDKYNTWIYSWLKNDSIPEWGTDFEQLLTDYDVSYRYKDTRQPCMMGWLFDRFDPNVEAVYVPKGNHPTSLLPFTLVDYSDNVVDRGYNAETMLPGFDPEAFSQLVGSDGTKLVDRTIELGRNRGETLGNVIFGGQPNGSLTNPDAPTTGWRADVPKETHISDDIMEIGKDYEDAWDEEKKNIQNSAWTVSGGGGYYPRSSYGGGWSSGGGSYNYNPKIYSNPRNVNADRAATMYTKTPQTARTSYLRPGFSTKGSREAYKRQDI